MRTKDEDEIYRRGVEAGRHALALEIDKIFGDSGISVEQTYSNVQQLVAEIIEKEESRPIE